MRLPCRITFWFTADTSKGEPKIVADAYCTRVMAFELTRAFFEGSFLGQAHRTFIESTFDNLEPSSLSQWLLDGRSTAGCREVEFEDGLTRAEAQIEYVRGQD